MRKLSLLILGLILTTNMYAKHGDIHGRNLNSWFVGIVGHIGLEEYGSKIYEMLSGNTRTSAWGYKNSHLNNNSISNFKNHGGYWGAKYWKGFKHSSNSWRLDSYIMPNTKLMFDIGADYTYSTFYRYSKGKIYKNRRTGKIVKRVPLPGSFRCDTLVKSMYKSGGVVIPGITIPYIVYNNMPSKR